MLAVEAPNLRIAGHVLDQHLGQDPYFPRGMKVIGQRNEGSRKIVPPSKEALRRLIEVADEDFRLVLIFASASATGLRAGGLHALRHFAVSCWIEAGLNPKTVQTFAGHSSLQVTMDRYGHLFHSDDHKAAMDEVYQKIFEVKKV